MKPSAAVLTHYGRVKLRKETAKALDDATLQALDSRGRKRRGKAADDARQFVASIEAAATTLARLAWMRGDASDLSI